MALKTVSVLGTGAIGSAMARALLGAGYPVTVWNRTAERTTELAAAGAAVAGSPVEAAGASELAIVCFSNMDVSRAVLVNEEMASALAGKTVAQVTSATTEDTLAEAAWAEQHGVDYLKGFTLSFPRGMGTPNSLLFAAGPPSVFERHRDALASVAPVQYVGEDLELACVYGTCSVWVHYASMYGLLYAAAYAEAKGVSMSDVVAAADKSMFRFVDEALEDASRRIETRAYSGEEASLATHLRGIDSALDLPGMTALGLDLGFAPALKALMERAVQGGAGERDFTALFELVRAGRA